MVMNNKILVFALLALFSYSSGYSQEKLVSAGQNPAGKLPDRKLKTSQVMELPFLDDFSGQSVYPDPDKWSDFRVYINNTYPLDQPGFGVATFDCLDSLGNVYDYAEIQSFRADYLTSHPINLDLGGDTTVYLSFFYQAQGLGDAPEPGDSLVLEFYSPGSGSWNHAWSVPGKAAGSFEQALVKVEGAVYLQAGFRFRFVNYASLANAYEPSLKLNADHWHLDYIYLNNNRNNRDTVMPDLSLVEPVGSLLLDYTSLPWEHYKNIGLSAVKTLFPISIHNLSGNRYSYKPSLNIIDLGGMGAGYHIELNTEEIRSFERLWYEAPFNYGFQSEAQDSAIFSVELDLQPVEQDLIPGNTKLISIQEFRNYYAYDDGTAEAGYGLVGEGAGNGRVAYRFENLVPSDSLIGVNIFFNRSFDKANQKYFNLGIWNEINGKPGDLIYRMNGLRAGFSGGLTQFDSFLLDSAQIVPSVYYIGWIQVTSDFLNVGFDKNNNNREHIFYTMDGVWRPTGFEGSLMIRPVFANKSKKTGIKEIITAGKEEELNIYPNPASSYINLDYPESWADSRVFIVDIQGRKVFAAERIQKQLNLPGLGTGTYFLVVQNPSGKTIHHKLLVSHE